MYRLESPKVGVLYVEGQSWAGFVDRPFAAYGGDADYVFVCYAHEDSKVVYPEIGWLKENGVNIWYDEGISPGENWRAAIGRSLDNAGRVLFYISPKSLASDHCNREVNLALDEGKEIIPVYLQATELTPDFKVGLSRVQALHRDDGGDQYLNALLSILGATRAEAVVAPTATTSTSKKAIAIGAIGIAAIAVALLAYQRIDTGLAPPDEKPYVLTVPLDVSANDGTNWEPFADQMTREIIRNLRKVTGLRVVPAPSAFAFRDNKTRGVIAAHLPDVRYVLDGFVSVESREKIRVTLTLEDMHDDARILWDDARVFSGKDADLFEVQTQIANAVSRSLKVAVLDSEKSALEGVPTSDIEAYQLYAEGLQLQLENTNESLIRSIELFGFAIERDPEFVLAHVAKADSYRQRLTFFEPPVEMLSHVQIAATKAITLDPESARARTALGWAFQQSWHFDDAWRYLSDARARDPSLGDAHLGLALYYTSLGEEELALASLEKADELDPLNPEVANWGVLLYLMFDRLSEGVDWGIQKLDVHSDNAVTHLNIAWIYSLLGEHERAIELAEASVELDEYPFFKLGLAQVYAQAGQGDDALNLLDEVEASGKYVCPYETAVAYVALGDHEEAFRELDRAVDFRSNCLMFTRQEPRFDSLRNDVRFEKLLQKIHLDDVSVAQYER